MTWRWKPYQIRQTWRESRLRDQVLASVAAKKAVSLLDYGCGSAVRIERIIQYLDGRATDLYPYDIEDELVTSAVDRLKDKGKFDPCLRQVASEVRRRRVLRSARTDEGRRTG